MGAFFASFKNRAYLQSSVTFLLFFASWGIWWSFFQIWLTSTDTGLGLSGAQVGTVYSINSIGTLIIMFIYGTVQDKLDIRRHLVIGASVIMTLVGPFFLWVYLPLLESAFMVGVVAGAIFLSAGFMSGAGLFEALNERVSRRYGFEYGQARMWGSFGYAMVALAAGFLFTINPILNFMLGSVFGFLCLMVQLFWRLPKQAGTAVVDLEKTPGLREMAGLLKMKQLWVVIGFVFMSWTFYTVFDQQMFPEFYTQLFSDAKHGQQMYGVLNSIQVFLEAIMMGVVPLIMRKIGVRNTLMLGILVMFGRILGCATFSHWAIVSFFKLFHALEVPLCILPMFRYFTLHFNPALSATLYMVGFNISAQIGNVVLSPILGRLRDGIGYQPTFFVITAVVAVAGIYGLTLLKKDHEGLWHDDVATQNA